MNVGGVDLTNAFDLGFAIGSADKLDLAKFLALGDLRPPLLGDSTDRRALHGTLRQV